MNGDESMTANLSTSQPISASSSDGLLVPTTTFPDATKSSKDLVSLLQGILAENAASGDTSAITKLIELSAQDRAQTFAFREAEVKLREKEINNKHELALRSEERKTKADEATRTHKTLFTGLCTVAFLASLGCATFLRDSNLADKVFTGAVGVAGLFVGAGGKAVLSSQKSDEKEQDKP